VLSVVKIRLARLCGTILHYTGSSWSDLSTGSGWFMGVWGSGLDDAWIVGTTTFRHWDGTAWTALLQTIPSMYEISGTSATDVWAVGANGEIQHCGPRPGAIRRRA
jgi:hypothetical protein